MQRFVGIAIAMLLSLLILVPVALAADPTPDGDRVMISVNGDLDVPAGQEVGTVLIVNGTATIAGTVENVVAINGEAIFTGATAETVVAFGSSVTLDATTVVTGDVRTLDSTVEQAAGATVGGEVRDLAPDMITLGLVLAPAILLFAIGFALASIVAGLALAGVASRQVRETERLISREPGPTLVAGLLGLIVPPVVAILAMMTIVGAPLGLGILLGLWPLLAFVGYLVAGIWIGDWILGRMTPNVTRERPYLASVIGIVLLQVMSILPLVTAIASLFGFGAVILAAWRSFRGGGHAVQPMPGPTPAPMAA